MRGVAALDVGARGALIGSKKIEGKVGEGIFEYFSGKTRFGPVEVSAKFMRAVVEPPSRGAGQ